MLPNIVALAVTAPSTNPGPRGQLAKPTTHQRGHLQEVKCQILQTDFMSIIHHNHRRSNRFKKLFLIKIWLNPSEFSTSINLTVIVRIPDTGILVSSETRHYGLVLECLCIFGPVLEQRLGNHTIVSSI